MNESDVLPHGGLAIWSPNGAYLLTTEANRIFVRDAATLQVHSLFTCRDMPSELIVSHDNTLVLASQLARSCAQLFSLVDPTWSCTIDESLAGLAWCTLSPRSTHVLTCTEFQLRLTVWSLLDRSVAYIRFPKFAGPRGCKFSHDGTLLALLERREFKDYIEVFSTDTWTSLVRFAVETEDASDIEWSPDDAYLAVHDNPLDYTLLVYTPDGRRLARHRAYEHALGVKSLAWSPSSLFLAVGSYDECVRVFNDVTWRVLAELHHPSTIRNRAVHVYREVAQGGRLVDLDDDEDADASSLDASFSSALSLNDSFVSGGTNDHANRPATSRTRGASAVTAAASSRLRARAVGTSSTAAGAPATARGSLASSSSSSVRSTKTTAAHPLRPATSSSSTSTRSTGATTTPRSTSVASRSSSRPSTSSSASSSLNTSLNTTLDDRAAQLRARGPSKFELADHPFEVLVVKPSAEQENPKMGVSICAFSRDDQYLATKNDNMPNTVFVWSVTTLQLLAVLHHLDPVLSLAWCPTTAQLAVCTGTQHVFMWRAEGCAIVAAPDPAFQTRKVVWNAAGTALIAVDRRRLFVLYLEGFGVDQAFENDDDGRVVQQDRAIVDRSNSRGGHRSHIEVA